MLEIAVAAVPLELKNPFTLAHGTSLVRNNVFLRLRTKGLEAWGEAAVVPYYHISEAMIIEDMRANITESVVRGDGELTYSMSNNALSSALLGLEVHKSGVDERTLLKTTGGEYDEPTSFTIAYDADIGRTLALIEASPFTTIKVKGGFSDDAERLGAIRRRFGDHTLYLDANQGWDFEEAKRTITALRDLDIALIEEPMKGSPEQIRSLKDLSSIPILLDETIQGEADLDAYRESISGVVVKLAKSGGPKRARALIERARTLGFDVMLSCMVESSVAITYALALSPLCRWLDVDGPLLLQEDMGTGIRYDEGRPRAAVASLHPSDALVHHFTDALTWEIPL